MPLQHLNIHFSLLSCKSHCGHRIWCDLALKLGKTDLGLGGCANTSSHSSSRVLAGAWRLRCDLPVPRSLPVRHPHPHPYSPSGFLILWPFKNRARTRASLTSGLLGAEGQHRASEIRSEVGTLHNREWPRRGQSGRAGSGSGFLLPFFLWPLHL